MSTSCAEGCQCEATHGHEHNNIDLTNGEILHKAIENYYIINTTAQSLSLKIQRRAGPSAQAAKFAQQYENDREQIVLNAIDTLKLTMSVSTFSDAVEQIDAFHMAQTGNQFGKYNMY